MLQSFGLGGLSFGNKHLRLGYIFAPMLSGRLIPISIANFAHNFFPTKALLSTYLTCHSSAIYTNNGICPPYILLTYYCSCTQITHWIILDNKSNFQNGAAHATFHSPRRDTLHNSGCATTVFWRIGALEAIVYNLKSIANFANLNVYLSMKFTWWPSGRHLVKCVLGWIEGGRDSPVIIL